MSTSMRPRTVDRPEGKNPIDVTTRSTSGKPRDRKKLGIPRECHTAMWQKRGTRSSRDPVQMIQKVERRATRTEVRSQEKIGAQTGATGVIAFPAQRKLECAIQPRPRTRLARRILGFPELF